MGDLPWKANPNLLNLLQVISLYVARAFCSAGLIANCCETVSHGSKFNLILIGMCVRAN